MVQTFYWFLPSGAFSTIHINEEFDLTQLLHILIKNEFWNRKINYEREAEITNKFLSQISSVKVKLLTNSNGLFTQTDYYKQVIRRNIGNISKNYEYIIDRSHLSSIDSMTTLEIQYTSKIKPNKNTKKSNENSAEYFSSLNYDAYKDILQLISIAREIGSLFMFCIHLTYPTRLTWKGNNKTIASGLIAIKANKSKYLQVEYDDMFIHKVLIERERFKQLTDTLLVVSTIWHKEFWTIHRYLKALRTENIKTDNFLDLVITLESLFPNNTSVDIIRTTVGIIVGDSFKNAQEIDKNLKQAFAIRNEIVHGGITYKWSDKYNGKETNLTLMDLFWELKVYVTLSIIYAIDKFFEDNQPTQNNLRISHSDIFALFFKKRENIVYKNNQPKHSK